MAMLDQQFELLRQAASDQERNWLLTRFNLEAQAPELADAILRAAILHWFDVPILSAILSVDTMQAEDLLRQIFALPFAEKYSDIGYTIHDQTREAILWHLSTTQNPLLAETAQRGVEYFKEAEDPQHRVEYVYLYLITHQEDGIRKFRKEEVYLRSKHHFSAAEHMIRKVKELTDLGIVVTADLNIEIERQQYLLGSSRADVIRQRKTEDVLEEHWPEISRIFGNAQSVFDKGSAFEMLNEGERFERTFLQQKIENAQEKGNIQELCMWKLELAMSYRIDKEFERALEVLAFVFNLTGRSKEAFAQRGDIHEIMGNYELAILDFNRAIELDDKYDLAFALRGETHRQMKNYELAILDFNRTIALDDKFDWAFIERGKTHRQMKNYELAILDFNRAIKLDDKYASDFVQRGETHRQMKNYELAILDFNRAIELNNKYGWAFQERGETYRLLKKYDVAIFDFTRSIELDKKNTWSVLRRSMSNFGAKNYAEGFLDIGRFYKRIITNDLKSLYAYCQSTFHKVRVFLSKKQDKSPEKP